MSTKTPIFKLSIGTINFNSDQKLLERVTQIDVDMVSDGASSFKVILQDDRNLFSEGDRFAIREGMLCTISIGYSDGGTPKLDKLIEGIVTGVSIQRCEASRKLFAVTGFDGLQSLTRGRKRRSWEKIKDSDIASIIANECGLQPDVEDSGIIHSYVVQNNETNLSFLYQRARRIGFEVKVEEKRLVFKKPNRTENSGITLIWGASEGSNQSISVLQRCDFETSTMNVVRKVIVRSYSPGNAQPIIGVADAIDGGAMGGTRTGGDAAASNNPDTTIQISDQPVESQEEAERLAASILNERAGNYLTGRGRCEGNSKLVCGTIVAIKNIGKELDGDYYITSAKHSLKVGPNKGYGYWTDFTVSRTGH